MWDCHSLPSSKGNEIDRLDSGHQDKAMQRTAKQIFKINDAARYLRHALPEKDHRAWWGYLKWNPKRWEQQDGIRINFTEVKDGKAIYVRSELDSFIGTYTANTAN